MTAALEGGEWSAARPGHTLPSGKDPETILQQAGWALGSVWTGGKSHTHRDSIPKRQARSSIAIPTELPGPQRGTCGLDKRIVKFKDNEIYFLAKFLFCESLFKREVRRKLEGVLNSQ